MFEKMMLGLIKSVVHCALVYEHVEIENLGFYIQKDLDCSVFVV